MKSRILITCIAVLVASSAFAQNKGVVEAGVGCAPFRYFSVSDAVNYKYQMAAYAEYRLPLGKYFDAGVKLDYKAGPSEPAPKDMSVTHFIGLIGVADFNLFAGKAVNPYIGLGIGPAVGFSYMSELGQNGHYGPRLLFCAVPRIGVELFNHLRVSVEADIVPLAPVFNPICFNIGWAF